jgi:hypothetical protein
VLKSDLLARSNVDIEIERKQTMKSIHHNTDTAYLGNEVRLFEIKSLHNST